MASEHEIEALAAAISEKRLSRYMEAADGNMAGAVRLYIHNTAVSEAFYTPLQGLEITLRNAMNNQLTALYGGSWYEGNPVGLQARQLQLISNALNYLRHDKEVTLDTVVAEMNLGFWVGLLGRGYDDPLWRQCLRHAFPHRPRGYERHDVHGVLNAVRRLRNRIAHHESILHRAPEKDHALILNAVSWICPVTAKWTASQSRVPEVLTKMPHARKAAGLAE
ncbi:MAG: hypothetical protein ACYYKD_12750 [Rhodospirillales bacterium]